ncbi:MAG: transporter substrate-binding domain-containing protein [Pseudomonadota bacterium]|nr:transporter substrate-binding domain-containing protein [Pseudomonadota bacterium]
MALRCLMSLVMLLSLSMPAVSDDKVVRLASLDWAPYTGNQLRTDGVTAQVVREAFAVMGYELEIVFYPWERAVSMGSDPSYGLHGFFPEYFREDIGDNIVFSDPVGYGPLGFAERKDSTVEWTELNDLSSYTIGTVQGYANTLAFDNAVAANELTVSEAMTDTSNLMKLAYSRVDLSVIDQFVFAHLMVTEPELKAFHSQLQFNQTMLEIKSLYVCFNGKSAYLADILNQGLAKIDIRAIQDEFFSGY